jgi:hypothetical protein
MATYLKMIGRQFENVVYLACPAGVEPATGAIQIDARRCFVHQKAKATQPEASPPSG